MNFLTQLISRIFTPEPAPMGRNGAMRLMLTKAHMEHPILWHRDNTVKPFEGNK